MNLTIHMGRYRFSLINCIAFAGSLCFLLAFFSKLPAYDIDGFFSSDSLYLPSIYKDLFIDGNSLKEWNLNPSPNFFPDMALYFLIMFVCKNSCIVSSFVYALVQYTAILAIASYLFKAILPQASRHWHGLIYLLFALFLMEYLFFTEEYYYSFYIISNAFHTGSFVMSLLCFLLSVHYYKKPSPKLLAGMFMIATLCIISDRLFIVLFCIPVVISCFFLVTKLKLKYLLRLALTMITATLSGLKIFSLLSDGHYFHIDQPHKLLAFDGALNALSIFSGQMVTYLSEFGFKAFTLYLFLLSFIATIVLFFRARKDEHTAIYYYAVFSTVFSLVVLSAPVINGSYTSYDTLRYNIYPFYFMALNIPICLGYFIKNAGLLAKGKKALAILSLLLLIGGMSSINQTGLKHYFTYYPETVKTLDGLAEKNGLMCGVGNYWEAKKVTMFSKKGLRVYAVFDDLGLFSHVANNDWFFSGKFNFIVLNGFQDTTLYKSKILSAKPLHTNGRLRLVKTNVFTYQKDKGSLPINPSGSE